MHRQNYTPPKSTPNTEKIKGALLAVGAGLAGAILLFYGLSS